MSSCSHQYTQTYNNSSEVKWKLQSHVQLFMTPWKIYTVHGILQARILAWVAFPFFRGSSQSRDRTQVLPHCRWNSLPTEPQGKPKKTGMGNLVLLQRIFPTQELNLSLLHHSSLPTGLSQDGFLNIQQISSENCERFI